MSFILLFILNLGLRVSYAHDACFHVDQKKALSDVIEYEACRELNVGEEKIVNFSASASPSTVEHKYVLERINKDEYKIKLNLLFRGNKIFQDKPKKMGRKMQTRINKCLEEMNPKLLGPDREKITIELIPWAEKHLDKYKEIKSIVFVDDKVERQNSHLYESQIDCDTILHEIFHLLGLVDEYKETLNILPFEKDCRSIGPNDSVMRDSASARRVVRSVSTCECSDTKLCKSFSEEEVKALKSCPSGYSTFTLSTYFIKDPKGSGNWVEETANEYRPGKSGTIFTLPPVFDSERITDSVLYPAHFRAVIFPGCKAKNAVYYSCARDAYFRPWKVVGTCSQKPAACRTESDWLK